MVIRGRSGKLAYCYYYYYYFNFLDIDICLMLEPRHMSTLLQGAHSAQQLPEYEVENLLIISIIFYYLCVLYRTESADDSPAAAATSRD